MECGIALAGEELADGAVVFAEGALTAPALVDGVAEAEEDDDALALATTRSYSSGASGPLMVAARPEASAGRRCWKGWSGCSGRCSRVRGADRGSAAVRDALGPGIAVVMLSLIIALHLSLCLTKINKFTLEIVTTHTSYHYIKQT